MTTTVKPSELLPGPDLFLQSIDIVQEKALFVRLRREDYQKASFLDGRSITAQTQGGWMRFGEVSHALSELPPRHPPHFIFHSGHVGSTLLSRLIEAAGGVLALREPLTLRTLAELCDIAPSESLLDPAQLELVFRWHLALWGRGYPDTRAVVVKATSSASRVGARLLSSNPDSRAICLNLRPEPFLATLLAGPNSRLDLRGHGQERMHRLTRISHAPETALHAMSLGELCAMAWAVETLTQQQLHLNHGARVLHLDFEALLRDPASKLAAALSHLNIDFPPEAVARILAGPTMQSYAKAPEAPYSPALRAQLLNEARARHGDEIRRGMRWLERYALSSPALAALLQG